MIEKLFPTKISLPEEIHLARIAECKCRKELQKKYDGTYAWARRNNLLDKYFPKCQ